MLSSAYRGRLSFMEAYNLPIGTFNVLFELAMRKAEVDGGAQATAEVIEDAMGGAI